MRQLNELGVTILEYALLLALIAVMGSIMLLSQETCETFSQSASALEGPTTSSGGPGPFGT